MHVIHVTIRVQPGTEAAYERWKVAETALLARAPGFLKRMLMRDDSAQGTYHYVSCWRSNEDRSTFEKSPELVAALDVYQPSKTYREPPAFSFCTPIVDEQASALVDSDRNRASVGASSS